MGVFYHSQLTYPPLKLGEFKHFVTVYKELQGWSKLDYSGGNEPNKEGLADNLICIIGLLKGQDRAYQKASREVSSILCSLLERWY